MCGVILAVLFIVISTLVAGPLGFFGSLIVVVLVASNN